MNRVVFLKSDLVVQISLNGVLANSNQFSIKITESKFTEINPVGISFLSLALN